jgi:hypothetical protein
VIQPKNEPYVVWSNEHRCWWGPDRCGYRAKPLSLVEYSSEDVTDPEKGDLVWIDGPDWLLERDRR